MRAYSTSLLILGLAPTVLSRSSFNRARHAVARREAAQDFNLDAGAIFPPTNLEKRALLGAVGDLVEGVVTGVNGVVSTVLAPLAATTTPITTTPVVAPTTAVPTPSNAPGDTTAPSAATTTNNNNPANPTNNAGTSPTTAVGAGAGENPSNGSSSAGSAAVSGIPKDGNGASGGSANSANGTGSVIPRVVTDHAGNSMTITAPVTMTYVTTLPNGVVSTVTETFTPDPAPGVGGEPEHSLEPSKIAAIIGTIVAVFLITFTVAFVFLLIRKRQKRAIALSRSNRSSGSSFGSLTDEWAHDERRNSRTALAASASTPSFRTASAFVDGTKLDFPLPPVPALPSRPVSGQSNLTFDFSQHGHTSIIEERNKFKKIGQYPDADSYTPFAIPPSEVSHTEESVGPARSSMLGEKSTEKNFHDTYRSSKNYDLMTVAENPFSDPVTTPTTSNAPSANLLVNNDARRSSLWRSATFGGSINKATQQTSSPSRDTMASLSNSEYGTAQSHGHDDANESISSHDTVSRRPSNSTGRYSYHSAFETYVQAADATTTPATENPFADQPSTPQSPPVTYPLLRPDTGVSILRPDTGTSIMSGGSAARQLGATPDPRDLFYHSPSPDRGQTSPYRISQDSRASSDGGATVRASHVAYPGLWNLANRVNSQNPS